MDLILKRKLGKKYGGLLDISDSVMITNSANKYVILCVLIVKSKTPTDVYKVLKELLQSKVFENPQLYPKLTSTQHVFCGYPYWISNDYRIEDCLRTMSVDSNMKLNEENLKELAGNFYNKPFPKNDTGLWDIAVGQQTVEVNKQDEFYYYPVIIRINHAIGDGISLNEAFQNIIGDPNIENYSERIFEKIFKRGENKSKPFFTRFQDFMKLVGNRLLLLFYIIFIGFGKIILNSQFQTDAKHALHGPEISGDKIVAWRTEDYEKCIPMVKSTKNRIPNTTFSDVILTGISAGLNNYFKRNKQPVPKRTTGLLATQLEYPMTDKSKPAKLVNKTTLLLFELPLERSESLMKTLETVKEKFRQVTFGDALVNSFLLSKLAGVFPINIAMKLYGPGEYTCLISNLPGCSEVSLCDGLIVDQIIPFAPNAKKVGLSIALLSYDSRFQLGVLVDKAILSSQKEAQTIADDIFDIFHLLDMDSGKIYKND